MPASQERSLARQFLRFACVGATGTAVQYLVLWGGVEAIGWPAALSSALGYMLGSIVNYLLNYFFTFGSDKSHAETAAKYYAVLAVGLGITAALMALFVSGLGWNYWVAQIVTTGIALLWHFAGSRWWAFKPAARELLAKGPSLRLQRIESLDAYRAFVARPGTGDGSLEMELAARHPDREFTVPGRCWVDHASVEFKMDYLFAEDLGDRRIPNWRERMSCPVCGMNNRQRAGLHVATQALRLGKRSRVYITEQVSSGYAAMAARHPLLIGSEFVGADVGPGSINERGVRHEDLMRLSLPDRSVDAILTFDVLEHVLDYKRALSECHRVLAPGGALLFSIPFMQDTRETRTRARFDESGHLVHLHPPAYHGDPLRPEAGVLCFHDFGWDILDAARAAGFSGAAALAYHSLEFGYLGGWQLLFEARKRRR